MDNEYFYTEEIQEEYIPEPEIQKGFKVYARLNDKNEIIEVGSEIFIKDLTGWTLIDEGVEGDRGAHAQGQYFDKPLMNDDISYTYSYIGGRVIEN